MKLLVFLFLVKTNLITANLLFNGFDLSFRVTIVAFNLNIVPFDRFLR